MNNHLCQVVWRSTSLYLSLVTTPLWWMGLDQPWGLRSEFGLWSKSLSSFIRLSLGRRKWKFWIWTDWCPVWFQLRCGRLLDSRFRTRFGLNILSLQNPERFVWPSAIGQGYLLASAAWILDSAHVLLAQCTFEDIVLKTLHLICLSLIMRDFQEAKDLRLVVTLSKGTRAGAAIAMDDIKVYFELFLKPGIVGGFFRCVGWPSCLMKLWRRCSTSKSSFQKTIMVRMGVQMRLRKRIPGQGTIWWTVKNHPPRYLVR